MKKDIMFNIAIIVMEVIGLTMEFITGKNFFIYYTVNSNIIALLAAVVYLVCRKQCTRFSVVMRYTATCALTLTMLVVLFVLMPMHVKSGTALSYIVGWDSTFVHVLCPVASFISFVVFEDNTELKAGDMKFPIGYTIIYGVILIILNITGRVYGPYNFLRVYEQPVWASVLWTIVIFGAAALISWLVQKRVSCKGEVE